MPKSLPTRARFIAQKVSDARFMFSCGSFPGARFWSIPAKKFREVLHLQMHATNCETMGLSSFRASSAHADRRFSLRASADPRLHLACNHQVRIFIFGSSATASATTSNPGRILRPQKTQQTKAEEPEAPAPRLLA